MSSKIEYYTYEEAKAVVHPMGLESRSHWYQYIKSSDFNLKLPKAPQHKYKNNNFSWGDFLGTGNVAPQNMEFLSYEEAKKIVHPLSIKTQKDWFIYAKSYSFNKKLPSDPNGYYRRLGNWISWGDFLGTGTIASQNMEFLSYEEAKKIVHLLNFKSQRDWFEYIKSSNFDNRLPKSPYNSYSRTNEWKDWGDFLGTGNVAPKNMEFLSYEEAKKIVHPLNLNSFTQWKNYTKSLNFDNRIPKAPHIVYRFDSWISWGDFLGTGTIASQHISFMPYSEAINIVHPMKFKGEKQWREFTKTTNFKNLNLPVCPAKAYEKLGCWNGWGDFFGSERKRKWTKKALIGFLKSFKENKLNEIESPVIILLFAKHLGAPISKLIKTPKGDKSLGDIIKDLSEGTEDSDNQVNIDDIEDICDNLDQEFDDEEFEDDLDENDIDIKEDSDSDLDINEDKIRIVEKFIIKNTELSTSHEVEAIINICVNALWRKFWKTNDANAILNMKRDDLANSTIIQRFEEDYLEAAAMQIPDGYSSEKIPADKIKIMQKLICTKLAKSSTKSLGNYSKAGAGKTLSAILASRHINAQNTLLLAMNSTCEQWAKEINEFYPDSIVFDYDGEFGIKITDFPTEAGNYNWVILNFEKFQQVNSKQLVEFLINLNFDFIVVDEMQNIKVRGNDVTKRRQHIEHLVSEARKNNPDLHLLAMSATPFMNELKEVKSILRLILNDQLDHLQEKNKLFNALAMHTYIVNYGVREIPNYGIESNFNHHEIEHDNLDDILQIHRTENILHKEELLSAIKLNHISNYIKPGTIIYSHYTDNNRLLNTIAKRIRTDHNLKVEIYSNQKTEEREIIKNKFINGEIDVLVASQTISTGVDGLQKVCDNMIIMSLPWTQAHWEQLVSRIARQGGKFANVNIIIPTVKYTSDKGTWSWDEKRQSILEKKKNWGDAVMDGVIPSYTSDLDTFQKDLAKAHKGANKWIEELESKGLHEVEENPLSTELSESEIKQRNITRFSELNRNWKVSNSNNLHQKLHSDRSEWDEYHKLYSEARKDWDIIPAEEIAQNLIKNVNWNIADLGCGECILQDYLKEHNIQGFDHVQFNDSVIKCDISNIPCEDNKFDAAVLSLALMGQNWESYIAEANRILNNNGFLLLAENAGSWEGQKHCQLIEAIENTGFQIIKQLNKFNFIFIKAIKN
jgi:superfamily II DNA or RNA helicase